MKACLSFLNEIVQIHQYSPSTGHSSMALPVEQIMSQLQRGDCEDIEEEDDIAEGPELEEELGNEELFKDTKLEIIEGERDGCNWLVIDDVHICFLRKDKGTKETTLWECSGRRRLGCEFRIRTTNPDGAGALEVVKMSDPEIHTCSADKVAPLMQKFRLQLAKRMTEDLDVGWSKIWNEERGKFLQSLSGNPELSQQVVLEMADVEAFRSYATRRRAKMVPKIPKDHKDMDPEKVKLFTEFGAAERSTCCG